MSGRDPASSSAPSPSLTATCWGARGSVPSPGPDTARFGGNTSCLEVRTADGRCSVFDGGTGIRPLGRRMTEAGTLRADLFLTHFHWDHIQGIPFFAPLYDSASALRIHGAQQGAVGVRDLFAGQMTEAYFPVPFDALRSQLEFVHLDGEPWADDGLEVRCIRVNHPGETYGYRITSGNASVAYVPDNETGTADRADYERLVDFLAGADLLYHDAMYTPSEYSGKRGWGHSTPQEAVQLAEAAAVRRLRLFHHAPDRTDQELLAILDALVEDAIRRGSSLEISIAAEGEEILLW